MLEARHFTNLTDHKPLTFAFQQKRDNCSPRQFKHLEYISQFTTDIRHISGRHNIVADTLSRVVCRLTRKPRCTSSRSGRRRGANQPPVRGHSTVAEENPHTTYRRDTLLRHGQSKTTTLLPFSSPPSGIWFPPFRQSPRNQGYG
jgi:hypothetical protein